MKLPPSAEAILEAWLGGRPHTSIPASPLAAAFGRKDPGNKLSLELFFLNHTTSECLVFMVLKACFFFCLYELHFFCYRMFCLVVAFIQNILALLFMSGLGTANTICCHS